MPRLSEQTRAQRRQHILSSAWMCFSRDGFHAASMDQVIAETPYPGPINRCVSVRLIGLNIGYNAAYGSVKPGRVRSEKPWRT
jgi:hypothetical protein